MALNPRGGAELSADVYLVGPQPPPIHGLSTINMAVATLCETNGLSVTRLNTAARSLERTLAVRVARSGAVFRALWKTLRLTPTRRTTVYLSLSGGIGLCWEAMIVWAARRKGHVVIVHHHSFRAIDATYFPMWLLVWMAGPTALHVVLCRSMGSALRARYKGVRRALVLSNASFMFRLSSERVQRSRVKVIGHLSNLSEAKGVFTVLDLAEAVGKTGRDLRFFIAGPFEDADTQRRFEARQSTLKNVSYLGPVAGEAKEQFRSACDVFVFPTRYKNEAEPLVILEALAAGAPVVAVRRGCIEEMISEGGGVSVHSEAEFVHEALRAIETWCDVPESYELASQAAGNRFQILERSARNAREMFLRELKGSNG